MAYLNNTMIIRQQLVRKVVRLFNEGQLITSVPTAQNATALHLYGVKGSAPSVSSFGSNDLLRVFSNDPSVIQNIGPSNPKIGKILFASAVLDFTLSNVGNQDLEVDIYYGYHRKDATSSTMVGDFDNGALESPIQSGNTTLDIKQRGVTYFDLSTGLSTSGYHVVKKQKMFIRVGQSSFIQYRDPRNHSIEWNKIATTGYGAAKLTYTVSIVMKTVTGGGELGQLAIGCTRKYSYTISEENVDVTALNP